MLAITSSCFEKQFFYDSVGELSVPSWTPIRDNKVSPVWTGGVGRQRAAAVPCTHGRWLGGGTSLCQPAQRSHRSGGETGIREGVNTKPWFPNEFVERVLELGVKSPGLEWWLCTYCVILGESLHISEPQKGENGHPCANLAARTRTRVRRVRHSPWVQNLSREAPKPQ